MSLDDADRRALEEIERGLRLDDPGFDARLTAGPGRPAARSWTVPVAAAAAVFAAALGWLAGWTGSPVPVLLALPVLAAVAVVLLGRHADRRAPADGDRDRPSSAATPADVPPWWAQ